MFEGSGESLTYALDEVKIEHESCLDGCYVIYTDVTAEDMTAYEVVKNYKSLIKVEQAFRNMKMVHLEIRPIFHKTDERIKCHVFICMLAYYPKFPKFLTREAQLLEPRRAFPVYL